MALVFKKDTEKIIEEYPDFDTVVKKIYSNISEIDADYDTSIMMDIL